MLSDLRRPSAADRADCGASASGAREAVARTIAALVESQRDGSHWVGTLSSSALATAISAVALHLIDAGGYAAQIARGRKWLLATQAEDGGWGDAIVDPSNVNATSLAYATLVLTGAAEPTPEEAEALKRAWRRLEAFGGLEAVGDPNRCTLSGPCRTVSAIAGLMDWRRIKRLRPEVILIPPRLRRTISTTFPAYLSISTLHSRMAPHPLNVLPTYRLAVGASLRWLERIQGANGSFEESAFLTSVILVGLTRAGFGHLPWLREALAFVVASQREDGGWPIDRDLETFDTDLTVFALHEAGVPVPNAAAVRDWLLARQFEQSCEATSAVPGGWAWAMPAGWPDSDDTSYTVLALRTLGVPADAPAIQRGADWLAWMQDRGGSWSTFVRGSRMPFDHDCPYITGHVLAALKAAGYLKRHPRVLERALGYLRRAQRADGSYASIWFRDGTAGTASVLQALVECGLGSSDLANGARGALLLRQNDDGGWAGARGQASTAEETAWAVMALLAGEADPKERQAAARGVGWLMEHQRSDGTWAEAPIGLYYSAMWYSDSYYAIALPLQALARAEARGVIA